LNLGYTPGEIAETQHMPASLEQQWSAFGYYGTLCHNAKITPGLRLSRNSRRNCFLSANVMLVRR